MTLEREKTRQQRRRRIGPIGFRGSQGLTEYLNLVQEAQALHDKTNPNVAYCSVALWILAF